MPPSMPPKIGIIGGGNVGQTLCKQLVNKGRPVVCGSRNPTSLQQQFTSQGLAAEVLSISDAVSQAEIVVLAIPGWWDADGVAAVVESLGPGISGKVVVDATNPLSGFPGLEVLWNGTSGGELLAAGLPDSHVYKAFNTVGTTVMAAVEDMGYPVQMMFAGPADAQPRRTVEGLISDIGFQPVYLGPIRYARNLEAMGELWIHHSVPTAGCSHEHYGSLFSFQLQRKPQP